jgi:hypothetical protein
MELHQLGWLPLVQHASSPQQTEPTGDANATVARK